MLMISLIDLERSKQHCHVHNMLRQCLKKLDIDYVESDLVKGTHGKPRLASCPDVHFNLSHSNGIAACVSESCECGIDCERVRKFHPAAMKRTFSETERELVMSADEKERDLLFFRLWTLKEAYVKALGTGISFPMRDAAFSFDGDRIITDLPGCTFKQYIIKQQYVVSLCCLNK